MRPCQGRSVARVTDAPVAGVSPTSVGSESGLGKACLRQYGLPVRGEDVVDEGLGQRSGSSSPSRVAIGIDVHGLLASGNSMPIDLVTRGQITSVL